MAETLQAGGNGYKKEEIDSFLKRIGSVETDIASVKGESMAACKNLHGDIKEIYKEAKSAGIPTKALRALKTKADLLQKASEVSDSLEDNDLDSFDALEAALGPFADTPLGAHFLGNAE